MKLSNRTKGFTLIETIMVIVITGILSVVVAMFMKQPVDAYIDSARRAALTDEADTALRRISRDIHKALPNSVHTPDWHCIEFIPTKIGGRYRAAVDSSGNGDILDFTKEDSSFDMFGLNSEIPIEQQIKVDDLIAIYNLGTSGSDAYNKDNTSTITAVTAGDLANETKITIDPKQFPFASSSKRFHVIPGDEQIVSFVCNLDDHKLYLNTKKDSNTPCVYTPGTTPILAQHVSYCNFTYSSEQQKQRDALVQITIQLTDDSENDETVTLYHETHVNNSP